MKEIVKVIIISQKDLEQPIIEKQYPVSQL